MTAYPNNLDSRLLVVDTIDETAHVATVLHPHFGYLSAVSLEDCHNRVVVASRQPHTARDAGEPAGRPDGSGPAASRQG